MKIIKKACPVLIEPAGFFNIKYRAMKKTVIYLIISSALLFSSCLTTVPVSQITNPDTDLEEGFIIDEKSIFEYDNQGFLIKEEFFENVDGHVEKTVIGYEYDNNLLVSKKYYDKNNKLKEYKIFTYDAESRILRETEYRADGSVKNYKDYKYSENGSYIKKYFKNNGRLYRYIINKYNSEGILIEKSDYEES